MKMSPIQSKVVSLANTILRPIAGFIRHLCCAFVEVRVWNKFMFSQQTLYTIMLRVGAPAHHSGIVPIDDYFSMDIPQPNFISRHSICMP